MTRSQDNQVPYANRLVGSINPVETTLEEVCNLAIAATFYGWSQSATRRHDEVVQDRRLPAVNRFRPCRLFSHRFPVAGLTSVSPGTRFTRNPECSSFVLIGVGLTDWTPCSSVHSSPQSQLRESWLSLLRKRICCRWRLVDTPFLGR